MEANLLDHNYRLQVVSNLEAMAKVLEWFEQFNRTKIPHQTLLQAQTALIEGFTNAVRHAHCHLSSPETSIDLEVQISPEYLQIRIWDQGNPFDLEVALKNLVQEITHKDFNPLDHESQWGCIFFLKLRKDYGWTISYTRGSDGRNCLLLKKNY
jgi:serine/threonine-protein kinase RsbW